MRRANCGRIILSLPTAMPIQEQRVMRSRANAAVKLIWDMMGWIDNRPPNMQDWTVRVSWDEATCAQLVYLYNEIVEKFSANAPEFFDLVGRPRKFHDPERPQDVIKGIDTDRSLRVASVDVGGGTTDVMVVTYHIQGDNALIPIQNFREGFRIAGDEVLREVIQQTILPALERIAGGRDRLARPVHARSLRPQQPLRCSTCNCAKLFLTRVLHPAGLGVLRLAEAVDIDGEDRVEITTLGSLLAARPASPTRFRTAFANTSKTKRCSGARPRSCSTTARSRSTWRACAPPSRRRSARSSTISRRPSTRWIATWCCCRGGRPACRRPSTCS